MGSSALRMVAILLALGAVVLGYLGFQAGKEPAPAKAKVEQSQVETNRDPIIIATKEIAPQQVLTEDDVTVIFTEKSVKRGFTEPRQVIGLTSRMNISPGDRFLPDHFYSLNVLTSNIQPGERAVAIKVDEVTGAGGFIEPGNKVDVIVFLPPGPDTGKTSSAQMLLPAIRVLAYGNQLEDLDQQKITQQSRDYLTAEENTLTGLLPDTNAPESRNETSAKQSKTAVLAVEKESVPILLLAESTGRIRLALRGQELANEIADDTVEKDNYYITTKALIPHRESLPPKPVSTVSSRAESPSRKNMAQVIVHRGHTESTIQIEQEQ